LGPHFDILSEGKMTLSHNCKVDICKVTFQSFLKRIHTII